MGKKLARSGLEEETSIAAEFSALAVLVTDLVWVNGGGEFRCYWEQSARWGFDKYLWILHEDYAMFW